MKLVIACILMALSLSSMARDRAQVREFRKLNACPATQEFKGACPGWVVDHIIPLCAGGSDLPSNMQWQDKATALEKDKPERALCAWIRRAKADAEAAAEAAASAADEAAGGAQ